jgi:hypothetical protein
VGSEVDHVRGPDTEGDEKLVAGNEDTTNDTGGGLSLVHRDDDGQGTDTDTVNEATGSELAPGAGGGDFDNDTDGSPESEERDTELATDDICESTGDKRTDSGTTTEKGSDGTLAVSAEVVGTIGVLLTETLKEVRHLPVTLRDVSIQLQELG